MNHKGDNKKKITKLILKLLFEKLLIPSLLLYKIKLKIT